MHFLKHFVKGELDSKSLAHKAAQASIPGAALLLYFIFSCICTGNNIDNSILWKSSKLALFGVGEITVVKPHPPLQIRSSRKTDYLIQARTNELQEIGTDFHTQHLSYWSSAKHLKAWADDEGYYTSTKRCSYRRRLGSCQLRLFVVFSLQNHQSKVVSLILLVCRIETLEFYPTICLNKGNE